MKNNLTNQTDKILFPIGVKLVAIISVIVILSLGIMTALVSWMVRDALKIASEETNFEVNRKAAAEAEDTLAAMRGVSGQFMHTLTIVGPDSSAAQQAARPGGIPVHPHAVIVNQRRDGVSPGRKIPGDVIGIDRDHFSVGHTRSAPHQMTVYIQNKPYRR